MSVLIKFSDSPPYYNGYWPIIDPDTDTIKRLVRVKSGRMYLCTSIPENTLPGRFLLNNSYDSKWRNAPVINNKRELGSLRYSYFYNSYCIFMKHEGRLSIVSKGGIYPLYWRRTSMVELNLLKLF